MDCQEINRDAEDSIGATEKLLETTVDVERDDAKASSIPIDDGSMELTVDSQSIVKEPKPSSPIDVASQSLEKEHLDETEGASCSTLKPQSSDEISVDKNPRKEPITSLSVIALAYENSDSEGEQTNEKGLEKNSDQISDDMEIQITKEYRNVKVTSDEESDSDISSCESSDDSQTSEAESDESDSGKKNSKKSLDTEQRNGKNNGTRRALPMEKESKSEFDDLPPIEDLKISVPEVLCDPLGEVAWMVEQMVVVRPKPGKPTLNLDTILFVERGRRVLGRIFDVFGQVSDPHYCVRFNSTEHIKESDIKIGMTAYFCPNTEYTSLVFVQDLLKMKATDELGDDEHPEFSDDEEERAYYAALKQKQKGDKAKSAEEIPQKRQRTAQDPSWKTNHPWSSGRKEQNRKPDRNYNAPSWTGNAQPNVRNPGNLWQQHYPPAYPGVQWSTGAENQRFRAPPQGWPPSACPSQNSYNYPPGNSRPSFRPAHPFHSGPTIPCMQGTGGPYSQQSNPRAFGPPTGAGNFLWPQRQPAAPLWRFPPPPPPPPPPPGI